MCISNFLKLYFIYWLVIKTVQTKKTKKKVISCQDMNSNLTHFSVQVLEGKPPHSMSNIRGVIKYINENSRVAKSRVGSLACVEVVWQ